jgi:LysM repeat protein
MRFSNIKQLYDALISSGYLNLAAKSLRLPANNSLGSANISDLLGNTDWYPDKSLALAVDATEIRATTIVIRGVFQQSFLSQPTPRSTVVFFLDSPGNAQLNQVIEFPGGWKFSDSFPALSGTSIDPLRFSPPDFVLASTANSTEGISFAKGLNFSSAVDLSTGPVQPLAWLWSSSGPLILSGPVSLSGPGGVPTMTLSSPTLETGLKIGSVLFSAGVAASSKPGPDGAETSLELTADLYVPPVGHLLISADIPQEDETVIELTLGSVRQPLASLNDLAALISGRSLTDEVPSQVPLGDKFVLAGFNVEIAMRSKIIASVGMTIGLVDLNWPIIPPKLIVFDNLTVTFAVDFPLSPKPSLSASINAQFTITTNSALLVPPPPPPALENTGIIVLGARFPGLTFSGFLTQGGTIDVIGFVAHFFGATASFDKKLEIDQLNFSVTVTDKTYSVTAGVRTGDFLSLDLGPSLPVPKITLEHITVALQRTQTAFFVAITADLTFLSKPWIVTAERSPNPADGWTFGGMLAPGQELTVQDVVNGIIPATWGVQLPSGLNLPRVTAFAASFNTGRSTFAIRGAIAWQVAITPSLLFDATAMISVSSARTAKSDPPKYSGLVRGDLKLNDIELIVEYAFQPNSSTLTFIFSDIKAVYDNNEKNPSLAISFGNKSLGDIVAFLVGFADPGKPAKLSAPWNVLNSISLNGLQIKIFFKTKTITIDYPINLNLGFITLNRVGFKYSRLYGQGNISLILDCEFLGQKYGGDNALQWNPTKDAPPALPGAGTALFDLQYLGLGQHVALRNTAALGTVSAVIEALKKAVKPIADPGSNPLAQLPDLAFDSSSNWLIGAQFSVMGTFAMSLVFNDPTVYGLLISLAGEKAGPLSGLRFEILYRKVTDKIGVFHVDLKLPDVMRRIQLGSVSLTLPVITVDVYTNGDFRLDFGFPSSPTDFSRCFAVEVFPFVGIGGFYFAKLSGETSTRVPVISNGRFDPVIEAGIALFVGVGKSISLGILSGGISVTVNGIIEGVYGYFEPTDRNLPSASYFWMRGTIAIVGKVYAMVDFGIIQANVSLEVYASVTLTIQVYEPINIQLEAGVRVSVSIKIIFIRITFQFTATVKASFVIGNRSLPPWNVVKPVSGARLNRLGALLVSRQNLTLPHPRIKPVRQLKPLNLAPVALAAAPEPIPLMFTPMITKALSTDLPGGSGASDLVVISAMLFIGTAVDPASRTPEEAMRPTAGASDAAFNKLLKRLLLWIISGSGASGVITADDLTSLYDDLQKTSSFDTWFSYENLSSFLSANVAFQIAARPTSGSVVSGAFFPMIPDLTLSTPNYSVNFSGPPLVGPAYEKVIGEYFEDLAVKYANSVERNPIGETIETLASAPGPDRSLATWVFRRYFLKLSQGGVQAAIDFLKNYTYTISDPDGESLEKIAGQFTDTGAARKQYVTVKHDTIDGIAATFETTVNEILAVNPQSNFLSLAPGTRIEVAAAVSVKSIVAANRSKTDLLRQWPAATTAAFLPMADIPQRPVLTGITYRVTDGDTLGGEKSIAERFGITAELLAQQNFTAPGLFRNGAVIALGDLSHVLREGETLQSVAQYYGLTVDALLDTNSNPPIALLAKQILVIQNAGGSERYAVVSGETVASIANQFQTTRAEILSLNDSIGVEPGRTVTLRSVSHTASGTFIVPYTATTSDTADTIIARYFGRVTPELRDLLVQWNSSVTDWNNLAAGTSIRFPVPDSFFELTVYYGISLSSILILNAQSSTLLAPGAVLSLPDIAPAITADDTFESLSERYNLALDDLAKCLAKTVGLFRPARDSNYPKLDIPNVPSMSITKLVDEVGSSSAVNHSAAMTSRFMLQGLRIPAPEQKLFELFASPNRRPSDSADKMTYPVFALIGQEFPAPVADLPAYNFVLKNPAAAAWVQLPDGTGYSPTGTLTFNLSPEEQQQILDFAKTEFQPNVQLFQRLPASAQIANQAALEKQISWTAAEVPQASCFSDAGQLSGQPTLWPLPDALLNTVSASPGGIPYKLNVSRPKPDGSASSTDAKCFSWASMIDLQLSRIPVQGSEKSYLDGTFLMSGTGQTDSDRLLRLLTQLATGDEATLYVLYSSNPADPSAEGYTSGAVDRTASVLLKTNLSTLTHGSQFAALAGQSASYSANLGVNDSARFLRLLWECSVVKSGGFYFTYHTLDGFTLPDELFGPEGSSSVALLVVLKSQLAANTTLLQAFDNVAILSDNIDISQSTLFARAVVALVGANGASTLKAIADSYASWKIGVTPATLATANATIPNLLRTGAQINIPNKPAVRIAAGATFDSIAREQQVDVGALGTANATADVLQPGMQLQLLVGQLHTRATLPPGNTGFLLTRTNPDSGLQADRATGAAQPQEELNTLFNLLGYSIMGNSWMEASGQGLPAGPAESDQQGTDGLSRRTFTKQDDGLWKYQQALKLYASAIQKLVPTCTALPQGVDNPYAGLIALSPEQLPEVTLALTFQDLNGNRTKNAALTPLTWRFGYTDELLPSSRWPSTSSSYLFHRALNQPELQVEWTFAATRYMPGPGNDYPQSHDSARADAARMQTVYFQTRMPDVQMSLSTSMAALSTTDADDLILSLRDYTSSALVFMSTAASLDPVKYTTAKPPNADTLSAISDVFHTDVGTLADANGNLSAPALFGASASLNIPLYYRFKAGDTFDKIVKELAESTGQDPAQLLEFMAVRNRDVEMLNGTPLIAKTRQITINNNDVNLASVDAISSSQFVAVVDGAAGPILGMANANSKQILTKGIMLSLDGALLEVGDQESLLDVAKRFGEDATVEAVAVSNGTVQRFFATGDTLSLPNYVVQPGDTLEGIAEKIGPANPPPPVDFGKVIQLLTDNTLSRDLYSAGTMLYYGSLEYAVQKDDTLASIAEQFAITIQDLGIRNADLLLEPDQVVRIPFLVDSSGVQFSTYRADAADTFDNIAALYPQWSNGVADLAEFNIGVPALFNPRHPITIDGSGPITPTFDDTFASLALKFNLGVPEFARKVGPMSGVVRKNAVFYAPAMESRDGETLEALSARFRASRSEFADSNASIYGLLAPGQSVSVAGYSAVVLAGDTFTSLAEKINALRAADALPPYVRPSDIGNSNPNLKLRASKVASPVRAATVAYNATTDYTAAIRPVTVNFTIGRSPALVDPEFKAAASVFTASSLVTAKPFDPAAEQSGADPLLSLRAFAEDFEDALAGFKLGTGAANNYREDSQSAACGKTIASSMALEAEPDPLANRELWAVNLGANGPANKRFNYAAQPGERYFYALPPLSNKLWDSNGEIPLKEYVSGQGLTGEQKRHFQAVDVDLWARDFLAAMDKFLTPEYAVPAYAQDLQDGTTHFTDIVTAKGNLAEAIKDDLQPILQPASGTGDLDSAKEAFYQQLLVELSAGYGIDAVAQYPFLVTSGCTDPSVASRLSGKPLASSYRTSNTGPANLDDIAAALHVSAPYLASVIQNIRYVLNGGVVIVFNAKSYTVRSDDTLGGIAIDVYGVDAATLARGLKVEHGGSLFRLNTTINVTSATLPIKAGATFARIAAELGTTVQTIILANESLPKVFVPGSIIVLEGDQKTVPESGRLDAVASLYGMSLDSFASALWSGDLEGTAKYTLDSVAGTALTTLMRPPVYSFTTGKLPLANGAQNVNFLFSVQDPAFSRSVFLDLDYAITEMEYDIVDRPDTGGYQQSAWLTFVLPLKPDPTAELPNTGSLGLNEIPVPLRSYPSQFTISRQAATAQGEGSKLGASSTFEWAYRFQANRSVAAQDSALLTIILNSADQSALNAARGAVDRTALFKELAQFSFVSTAVAQDLALLLKPQLDDTQKKGVRSALKAFSTMAQNVAANWPPRASASDFVGESGDLYKYSIDTITDAATPGRFAFLQLSALSGPVDFLFNIDSKYVGALDKKEVDPVRPVFESNGYPLSPDAVVQIETPGSKWEIIDADTLATFTLDLRAPKIKVSRKYLWPSIWDVSASQPVELPAQQLGPRVLYTWNHDISETAALEFRFERLNILAKQNAWGRASVKRNVGLVANYETNPTFVYDTPEVSFPSRVTPRIVISEEIDLRKLPSKPSTIEAALIEFLTELFSVQGESAPQSVRQVKAGSSYGFTVATLPAADGSGNGGQQIMASFPLVLVSQYPLNVSTGPSSFGAALAGRTKSVASSSGVPYDRGQYDCQVVVYSTLSGDQGQIPIVQYEHLIFKLPEG